MSEIKQLGEFQEVVGVLNEIVKYEEKMVLIFCSENKIVLPANRKLERNLQKKIGKRIGILRTDDENMLYLLRDASNCGESKAFLVRR